jgi:hypothetical protein
MSEAWSSDEVAATVSDYLSMLSSELRGKPYNKAAHRRQLQHLLVDRSEQAIEFKHANISAVLIELGLPYISGYKPRGNYQQLLREQIEARLGADAQLQRTVQSVVEEPVASLPRLVDLSSVIVPVPEKPQRDRTYERPVGAKRLTQQVNYLEREARNASLGLAGEQFVLEIERRRLWEAGSRRLADRIEHVSQTRGDGLGYDILSFDSDGRERLIEVKTTRFGQHTPFFVSANEVEVSAEKASNYSLYRLFAFREQPKLFIVPGALRDALDLQPVQYRASVA